MPNKEERFRALGVVRRLHRVDEVAHSEPIQVRLDFLVGTGGREDDRPAVMSGPAEQGRNISERLDAIGVAFLIDAAARLRDRLALPLDAVRVKKAGMSLSASCLLQVQVSLLLS
ncbi:hypothetical protein M673_03820 [Aureimonas sp. AU20]|nr:MULTISPECIES: hypothetical protein [unclassified Aureimonas]ALN71827.1 hypothetical protein M673_03820 [Aureimonas sp. AU20]